MDYSNWYGGNSNRQKWVETYLDPSTLGFLFGVSSIVIIMSFFSIKTAKHEEQQWKQTILFDLILYVSSTIFQLYGLNQY